MFYCARVFPVFCDAHILNILVLIPTPKRKRGYLRWLTCTYSNGRNLLRLKLLCIQ